MQQCSRAKWCAQCSKLRAAFLPITLFFPLFARPPPSTTTTTKNTMGGKRGKKEKRKKGKKTTDKVEYLIPRQTSREREKKPRGRKKRKPNNTKLCRLFFSPFCTPYVLAYDTGLLGLCSPWLSQNCIFQFDKAVRRVQRPKATRRLPL